MRIGSLAACLFVVMSIIGTSSATAAPPITGIAFAPDGRSLVTTSQNGVTEYTWPGLELQRTISASVPNLHDLAFSPSGEFLAVAGGNPTEEGVVEILSWPSGKQVEQIHQHADSVMSVAWIDDSLLASASMDHELVLWDRSAAAEKVRFRGHSKGVMVVCSIPKSSLLVSAGIDENLRVWDLASSTLARSLNNHTAPVNDLALRPDDSTLPTVVSSSEDKTVRIWQPSIGRMVRFSRLSSQPLQVEWLADGSAIVATCVDGAVRIVDPETVELVHTIPVVDDWASSMAVHPSDGSIAVGDASGGIRRVEIPIDTRSH